MTRSLSEHVLTFIGDLPRINRKYEPNKTKKGVRLRRSNEWKEKIFAMTLTFQAQWAKKGMTEPLYYPVDVLIMFDVDGRTDSDACIKGVFDALEEAGIVKNDNLIKDFAVIKDKKDPCIEDYVAVFISTAGKIRKNLRVNDEAINDICE